MASTIKIIPMSEYANKVKQELSIEEVSAYLDGVSKKLLEVEGLDFTVLPSVKIPNDKSLRANLVSLPDFPGFASIRSHCSTVDQRTKEYTAQSFTADLVLIDTLEGLEEIKNIILYSPAVYFSTSDPVYDIAIQTNRETASFVKSKGDAVWQVQEVQYQEEGDEED